MFTIDSDNNIASHAAIPASADNLEMFASERELAKIAEGWPAARLIQTWNTFAGVAPFDDLKPVRKFTSRSAAVSRLWTAVQRLCPDAALGAAPAAPARGKSKKSLGKATGPVRAQKEAKQDRSNKKAAVVTLMQRAKGVTLAEIMENTGWQKHTVRGFISVLGSKGGLKIESSKNAAGERCYRVTK